MTLLPQKVQDIVSIVQPGDILAFSGSGNVVSDVVRFATGSIVSHVGIILSTASQPQIIESTSLGGFSGVTVTDLVTRCTYYPGLIWYLPLRSDLQKKVDVKKLDDWLLQQKGKEYDTWGAVESALLQWKESDYWHTITSYWPSILQSHPDTQKLIPHWFCSELAAAALQQVDVLPKSLNPDLIRPTDLVGMKIYSGEYYQIKGDVSTPIPEYNSSPVESEVIFQTALVSKKPEVISEVAQAFEGLGAESKAKELYQRAQALYSFQRALVVGGTLTVVALLLLVVL